MREASGCSRSRHRWSRRGLYGSGCRRLRGCTHGQCQPHNAAHRGISRDRLAFTGIASLAQTIRDEMGVGPLTNELRKAVFLDRDGVLNEVRFIGNKPAPPASEEELRIANGAEATLQ